MIKIYAIAGLGIAAISAYSAYWITDAGWQNKWNDQQLKIAASTLEHQETLRERERQWSLEFNQVSQDAKTQENRIATDLAAAEYQRNSLHEQFAKATAKLRQCNNPTTTGVGEDATKASGMPAYVLTRLDERAGKLAEYADRLEVSLVACNSAYAFIYNTR